VKGASTQAERPGLDQDGVSCRLQTMPFIQLNDQPLREVFPGFQGRFVHSTHMTFANWTIRASAVLPEHAHAHEQVVNVLEGEFQLTVAGDTRRLGPASVAIIPSNAIHSGRAITDCRIMDAFYPIREDYR